MKKTFFFLFLLLSVFSLGAQELHINWNRFIGGDGSCPAQVRNSITTSDKGILFTGVTNCDNKGDMPPFNITGTNAFVGKLDSNQQLSWVKTIGGNQPDYGVCLFEFTNGDYGWGLTTESSNFPSHHGASDVLIVRLDNQGNILSQKCFGSPYAELVNSAMPTSENGVVVFGISAGVGNDLPGHYGNLEFWFDWWIFKIDSVGNIIWSKNFGGSDDELCFGSIIAVDDYYYIFCSSDSKDLDCIDTSWHSSSTNTGDDFFVMKVDTSGNLLWCKSYGGSAYECAYSAIFDSRDSTIVFTGESQSSDYMGLGNHGSSDVAVMKIDLAGNLIWNSMLGYASEERSQSSICKARDKGYMILANTKVGTIGVQDALVAYVDSNGSALLEKIIGSLNNENVASIHPYLNGFIATGSAGMPLFMDGANIGHQGESPAAFSFFTNIDYWPLQTTATNRKIEEIAITPNPASGFVVIQAPKSNGNLSIYNTEGKQIVQIKRAQRSNRVNTSDWNKGVYVVVWQSEDGNVVGKKFLNN